MRILALTRYERLGSSSRVRFYQYFPYIQAQGLEVVSAPFFTDDYVRTIYAGQAVGLPSIFHAYIKRVLILLTSSHYDILWLEKELFPWLPAWFELFLRASRIPYVVDYDDAVFHRYDMHKLGVVRSLLKHKIDHVMRRAAMVVVGNGYLSERAKQAGATRVEYLPSVVDVSRYKVKKEVGRTPFQIGWIGSPVTAPYLDVIREALHHLSRKEEINITLIGSGEIVPFPDIPTTILPWDEHIEQSIGEMFDAGIMPLIDGPFERGKCGYKLVQYMAGGLPVIASPIGINAQMVTPGINGYLASSTDEWAGAFETLIGNPQLAAEMGQASHQKAEQMYNLRVTAPRLLDLFSSVRKV